MAEWARTHGLNPCSLSRGFSLCYGISPKRYRLEHRVASTLRKAARSAESLALLSADGGFADQAHFARAAASLFGAPPSQLRHLLQSGSGPA